jgi:hypothetical protein
LVGLTAALQAFDSCSCDWTGQVLAEFALTGVVFTQGVNEMQTLANMSGGEAMRQVEVRIWPQTQLASFVVILSFVLQINNASYSRLRAYLDTRKLLLNNQIELKTRNLVSSYYSLVYGGSHGSLRVALAVQVKSRPKSGFNLTFNPAPSVPMKESQGAIDEVQMQLASIDK